MSLSKRLKQLLQEKDTRIGIAAALVIPIIFFLVWMTAYSGVENRIERLSIGLFIEDEQVKKEMVLQMQQATPFDITIYEQFAEAKHALDNKNIMMLIQVPDKFSGQLQAGSTTKIVYWINQANASMTKSLMESSAFRINEQFNKQAFQMSKSAMSFALEQQLPAGNGEQQSIEITAALLQMLDGLKNQSVEAQLEKVNENKAFSANMVPLMVIVSSFVAAMVLNMKLTDAESAIKAQLLREQKDKKSYALNKLAKNKEQLERFEKVGSRYNLFVARQLVLAVVAILASGAVVGLFYSFHIATSVSPIQLYGFQLLLFFSLIVFAQLFVVWLGPLGMVFNIVALSVQLVASGVLVSRELLPAVYEKLSLYLPATYGAEGYFTIVFGGSLSYIQSSSIALAAITILSLLVTAVAPAVKKRY